MKKLIILLLFAQSVTGQTYYDAIASLKSYTGTTKVIFITKDVQAGMFTKYTGVDSADNGMVFKDGLGRRWKRYTEGEKLRIKWYGLKPSTNYYVDDAPVINKALNYIKLHPDEFSILKFDECIFNTWYKIGSTITLSGVSIEGTGVTKVPTTMFAVSWDIKAFYIPAGPYVNVTNVAVSHAYNYNTNYTDSTNHSFDIHTQVHFKNVNILQNQNGDGFHVDACAGLPQTDKNYGNADHSSFEDCQTYACLNGLWVNGCDANIISFTNCSFVFSAMWAVKDNNLLGNRYYNTHMAANSQNKFSGARVNDTTFYPYPDSVKNIIGHYPPTSPAYWYKTDFVGGNEQWISTRQYYGGGPVYAVNVNANNRFTDSYTESFQPASIIGPRSTWSEGLNGAAVVGGVFEHNYNQTKFNSGNVAANSFIATQEAGTDYPALTGKSNGQVIVDLTTALTYGGIRIRNKYDAFGGLMQTVPGYLRVRQDFTSK